MLSHDHNEGPPTDWLEFGVRFVCGAVLGGLAGFSFCDNSASALHICMIVLVSGAVFGIMAGWFGDRFWHTLLRWWR